MNIEKIFSAASRAIPDDHQAHEFIAILKQDAERNLVPPTTWKGYLKGYLTGLAYSEVIDTADLYEVSDLIDGEYPGDLAEDCKAAQAAGGAS